MTEEQKLKFYRYVHDNGVDCLCTHCGERSLCLCSLNDLSAECYHCAVKRIEREEKQKARLKNFNYEDFIRL